MANIITKVLSDLKNLKDWRVERIQGHENVQKDNGEVTINFRAYMWNKHIVVMLHMWEGKVDAFSMNGLLIGPAIEAAYPDGPEFDFEEVDSNDVTIFDEKSETHPAPSWKISQKDWETAFPPIKEILKFFDYTIKEQYEEIIKKTQKLNKFCEELTKFNLLKYCELGVHNYDGEDSLTASIKSEDWFDDLLTIKLTDEYSQCSHKGNRYSFDIDFDVSKYKNFYFSEAEIEISQMPAILDFIEELRQKTLHLRDKEGWDIYQKPEAKSPKNIKEIITELQKRLEE